VLFPSLKNTKLSNNSVSKIKCEIVICLVCPQRQITLPKRLRARQINPRRSLFGYP